MCLFALYLCYVLFGAFYTCVLLMSLFFHAQLQWTTPSKTTLSQPLHVKARSQHPQYPPRVCVADDLVSWNSVWDDYTPVDFTHPVVYKNDRTKVQHGWADPEFDAPSFEYTNVSYIKPAQFSENGFPLNPCGRTGMIGRGLLGKWGANHAADPMVTRWVYNEDHQQELQMVVIQRGDTGEWALPGGMVDSGENVSETLKREFGEEAGVLTQEQYEELFDTKHATDVYKGYVDDPRNTDHAWMETFATHFHASHDLGETMVLKARDDAVAVKWLTLNHEDAKQLYASHTTFVIQMLKQFMLKQTEADKIVWIQNTIEYLELDV